MSVPYFSKKQVYTKKCKDMSIMVIFVDESGFWEGDGWEVYYRKEGHPYHFAFGLPASETYKNVFPLAIANMDNYKDLFD